MNQNLVGLVGAAVASFAWGGCSSSPDVGAPGAGNASVAFNLRTPEGVVITSLEYDLNRASGMDVLSGKIPIPNDDSLINGTIDSLQPGDYGLILTAVGTYEGEGINCTSAPRTEFTLGPSDQILLPSIELACVSGFPEDDGGRVTFNANVSLRVVNELRFFVKTFGVAPISVRGERSGASCVYPPIGITLAPIASVRHGWSASPDGTFTFQSGNLGTYHCVSDGIKELTVTTLVDSSASAIRTVQVDCGNGCGAFCGNGIVDPGEECDDAGPSERCTELCRIIEIGPKGECRDCILANPDLGPIQREFCDPEPRCLAVEECVLETDCFLPVPAACYCGPNVADCENPAFVPVGPCAEPIRAGLPGSPPLSNEEVLSRFYAFEYPTGMAILILDEASRACREQCFDE